VSAIQASEGCLDLASATVMGRLGLVRAVKQILREPGEPRLFSASSVAARTGFFARNDIQGHCGAIGFTWPEAATGAIGECIERYCCGQYEWGDLVFATQDELGPAAIGMDTFALYTPKQYAHPDFPFAQWRASEPIWWAPGWSLVTRERRYVPAALVYVPYEPRNRDKPTDFVALAVSSGQACHTDPTRALVTGLCEVIERDAFMIVWLRKLVPQRVDYMADPELRAIYDRYFAGSALTFHIFDITLDIRVPTMLCIVEGTSARGPFIATGAATRPTERAAIVKALLEGAQDVVWVRDLIKRKPHWRPDPDFMNVRDFEDHVRLFCEPYMVPHVDFLLGSTGSRPVAADRACPSPAHELQHCVAEVEQHGFDVVVVDTTSPEIAEVGFCVPKVFIPGTVQLTAIHGLPAVGCPRLFDVPARIGYRGPIFDGINPIPHPFP
jgi:ribosomal protein S12 methylthiotransferase accessory factor